MSLRMKGKMLKGGGSVGLALLMLVALLAGCKGGSSEGKGNINYGVSGPWDDLMPYNSVSASNVSRIVYDKIYDRLVYVKADGDCLPRAADSWESNADGNAIVFHLNKKAKFHDGTKVTAEHWVDTFRLMTNPLCPTLGRTSFADITGTDDNGAQIPGEEFGVKALDDYTFQITFKTPVIPNEYLAERNREFYVLPTHLLKDTEPADVMDQKLWDEPIGSGPLKFVSEIPGSTLTLEANKEYHLGRPKFETITMRVVDKSNQLSSLISGDLDYYAFGNIISEENKSVAEKAGFTVLEGRVPTNFYELMLNNETIAEKEIRQAISLAIDRELLARQNAGERGTPAASNLLPGSKYSVTAQEEMYRQNLDAAKELLKDRYDGKAYSLACTSNRASLAALIQQNLADAGMSVEIQTVDSATLFSGMSKGDYDMGLASHTPNSSPLWFVGTRFKEDNNIFHVKDLSGYKERISSIQMAVEEEEKLDMVSDLEQYLQEGLPFVPLWFTTPLYVESKTVSGIDYPASSFSNENTWEWGKQ